MPEVARILVVEDEPLITLHLEELLTGAGYEVRSATTGGQALELLHRWTPDLLLLDLVLPGINGRAFRHLQLRHQLAAQVPVVVMSGISNAAELMHGLGIAAFVSKPFSDADLLRAVTTALRGSRHTEPTSVRVSEGDNWAALSGTRLRGRWDDFPFDVDLSGWQVEVYEGKHHLLIECDEPAHPPKSGRHIGLLFTGDGRNEALRFATAIQAAAL